MWMLIQETTAKIFPVLPDVKYKVGRLSADLVLKDDKSISGTHAYLSVKKGESVVDLFELEDAGSKNGTFVNENIRNKRPLKKNSSITLCDGDCVQFGVMGNSWRVCHRNFCIVSSGLTSEEIKKLEYILEKFGGKHVSTFDKNCTHLTMKEIKVTLKLIHALLYETPIVNLEYWQEFLEIAQKEKKGPLSSFEKHVPRINDVLLAQQVVDFQNRPERKSIFAGKTFVFLSQKHCETYAPIVEKAGGTYRGLKNGVQKAFLLNKNVVVVQYVQSTESQNSQGTQTINTISDFLEANSRRFIPEYEIALAIVHCSTQKYCNPDYKIVSNMISSTSTLKDSESMFIENTSTNLCTDGESCDSLIIETEPSQDTAEKHSLEAIPADTKVLFSSSKDSITTLNKPLNSKRKMHNEMSSDSESEKEYPHLAKKMYVGHTVSKEKNLLCTSSTTNKHTDLKKFSYKALNVTISKTPQQIDYRRLRIPDMSENEEDLFNFGYNVPSPSAKKKKRTASPSNGLDKSSLASLKKKTANNNDESNLENDNDLETTQPFISKSIAQNTASLVKSKVLHQKISTEGWKTFSGKSETEIPVKTKANGSQDIELKDKSNWFNSEPFKGGFRVKISETSLRCFENLSMKLSGNETIVLSGSNKRSNRGFKKFVKQKLMQRMF